IRAVEEGLAVTRERRGLDRVITRCQRRRLLARRRRVRRDADCEVPDPLVRLRLKDHVILACPLDAVDRGEALIVLRGVPELVTFAACDVGDPERQRVAAGERRVEETGPTIARRLFALTALTRTARATCDATAAASTANSG